MSPRTSPRICHPGYATPDVTPDATPNVTPGGTQDVTPDGIPDGTPDNPAYFSYPTLATGISVSMAATPMRVDLLSSLAVKWTCCTRAAVTLPMSLLLSFFASTATTRTRVSRLGPVVRLALAW